MNATSNDTASRTLVTMLEDGRAHEMVRASFDHPTDGPLPVEIGTYVSSALGHYTTSEAIGVARSLGWEPSDSAELDYWLALYGYAYQSGAPDWTLDEHNDERARAGLGPVDEAGAEDASMMAGEMLVYYLDDAESWLDERTSVEIGSLISALVDEGSTLDDARSAIADEGIGAYWSHDEGWGLNLSAESLVY